MAFRPEFRVLRNNQEPFEKRHTVIRVICSRRIMVRFGYGSIIVKGLNTLDDTDKLNGE